MVGSRGWHFLLILPFFSRVKQAAAKLPRCGHREIHTRGTSLTPPHFQHCGLRSLVKQLADIHVQGVLWNELTCIFFVKKIKSLMQTITRNTTIQSYNTESSPAKNQQHAALDALLFKGAEEGGALKAIHCNLHDNLMAPQLCRDDGLPTPTMTSSLMYVLKQELLCSRPSSRFLLLFREVGVKKKGISTFAITCFIA